MAPICDKGLKLRLKGARVRVGSRVELATAEPQLGVPVATVATNAEPSHRLAGLRTYVEAREKRERERETERRRCSE